MQVPQKRGHVLQPPKILYQLDILEFTKTNKMSFYKQYFLQYVSDQEEKQEGRVVICSPNENTAKNTSYSLHSAIHGRRQCIHHHHHHHHYHRSSF